MNETVLAENDYLLSNEQVQHYRELGYIHLKSVFSQEDVDSWNAECDRLLADLDVIHEENWRTPFRKGNDGCWRLEKFDPVIDISDVFRSCMNDPRLTGPVSSCLGDEARLLKDKVIFKGPGQGGYGCHQDWTWWQPFPQDMLSAMIAIDGADASNGALEIYPAKHFEYVLPLGELRGIREAEERALFDEAKWSMIETEPGDVILFHCLAPHRSGKNNSTKSRRQLYPTYHAAKYGDLYEAHYQHYHEYVTCRLGDFEKARRFYR